MLYPHIVHSNEIEMFGDACLLACGGFVCDQWFQHIFTKAQNRIWKIHHKEAFASYLLLVVAVQVYELAGRKIRVWSDNEPLVMCMRPTRGVSRDPVLMDILRLIQTFALEQKLSFVLLRCF